MKHVDHFRVAVLAALMMLAWPLTALAGPEGELEAGNDATPYQNWQLILAVVLPLIVAAATRRHWQPWVQSLVMLSTALVATVGTMFLNGSLNDVSVSTFVAKFLEVVVATIALYYGVLKPMGVTGAVHDVTGG